MKELDIRDALILDAVRTPRGRGRAGGALHGVHPQDLLAQCLTAVADRVGFDPAEVDDVIAGNGIMAGEHGDDIARLSLLLAGWPQTVPGMTLNRFCGSGQQAVTVAAAGIASGQQELVVAGGVESMSRWDVTVGAPTIDGANPAFRQLYPTVPQGISADLIASVEGFSRADVDAFAVSSQDRAAAAIAAGYFDRSIIAVRDGDGEIVADRDEHPRAGTTVDKLAGLPPAFERAGAARLDGENLSFDEICLSRYPDVERIEHVHHAGNSSGVVDGAAVVVVASADWAKANGAVPRARVRAAAAIGSEPIIMLTAPGPGRRTLSRQGRDGNRRTSICGRSTRPSPRCRSRRFVTSTWIRTGSTSTAVRSRWGTRSARPGAMLIGTILDELERRDLTTGLVTMCTGGGMGTATIIERV